MTEIEQKVIATVAAILGLSVADIKLETRLEDHGADDIDRTELAMDLEDTFETELEDLDGTAAGWQTVQDVVTSFTSK